MRIKSLKIWKAKRQKPFTLHPSSISTWYIDSYRRNNIKAPFTSHPQIPCFYRHSRQKGEGWRVKSHSCFRKKIRYKDFSKYLSPVSLYKTTTNIFYKKEIREQNIKQIFMSHQVCKVPKEGHFCAEVRALLCPREWDYPSFYAIKFGSYKENSKFCNSY